MNAPVQQSIQARAALLRILRLETPPNSFQQRIQVLHRLEVVDQKCIHQCQFRILELENHTGQPHINRKQQE